MKHFYLLLCTILWGLTAQAQFCIPTYVTGPVQGDSIVSFQLGGINGIFPGAASGYNDYTAQTTTNLVVGQTYTIDLTNNPSSGMSVAVWIDYDQSNAFGAGELVGSTLLTPGSSGQITFTVPTGAAAGVSRLRMVSAATLGVLTPCGAYDFGETEDYGVTLIPPPADDMGVSAIEQYGAGACGLTAAESITVEVTNFGLNAQTTFSLAFSVNGGPVTTEPYTAGTLASGAVDTFTFAGTADFSGSNTTYTVQVWTTLAGDGNADNDTLTYVFTTAFVAVAPYLEDFETFINDGNFTGNGTGLQNGWTNSPAGPTSDYNWSVRRGTTGSGSTGPNVDHTLGTTLGAYMYTESSPFNGTIATLTSPCIDLTAAANPRLSFWYHMFGSTTGTLAVVVGNDTLWTLSGQQQTSGAEAWREAIVDLTPYAGTSIQLTVIAEKAGTVNGDMAIDDVQIVEPPAIDAAALQVISPLGGTCLTNAETIEVEIRNEGSNPLDFSVSPLTVSVAVQSPAGPIVPYTTLVTTGTLAPLATQVVTVTNSGDFSATGLYNLGAVVNLTGDPNTANDTTGLFTALSIPVTSLPFTEDFETFTESTGTTNAGTMDNDWTRNFIGPQAWFPNAGFTPNSFGTGPSVDHTLGTNAGIYMYTEASGPPVGSELYLLSPCIDLGSPSLKRLKFWYHMFGATMGTMEAGYVSRATGDTVFLWSLSGQQQTANADPWLEAEVNLPATLTGNIQLIFKSVVGGFNSDMAIDDVSIEEVPPLPDMRPLAALSPVTGCGLTATEDLTIPVFNFGAVANTAASISYTINGGAAVTEALPVIQPNDTFDFTFSAPIDLSVPGTYDIEVIASSTAPADGDLTNDTLRYSVTSIPVITTFPYAEGFEAGDGGWISGGDLSSWELGTPAKSTITGAASGANAWVTGGVGTGQYSNLERSFVQGPCFDFSSLSNPQIRMDIWWNSENNWDGTSLQVSTDGGATWELVGDFGDPNNWYTSNTFFSAPVGAFLDSAHWTGRASTGNGSGGWVTALNDLSSLAGNPGVLLRFAFASDGSVPDDGFAFDNVEIFEQPLINFEIVELIDPVTDCSLPANAPVTISYTNTGVQPFSTVDLSFAINAGTPVTETDNQTVNPGDTVTYTFTNTADLSVAGSYNLVLYGDLSGDPDVGNDTLTGVVENIPVITTFPYSEGFEGGNGGWTPGGTSSSWAFGTPAKNVITGAASGVNAWTTGGLGTGLYNSGELSFVLGPCFDFSTLSAPVIRLDVWWQSENGWDGAALQSSIDGGQTWQNVGQLNDPNNWYNRDNYFNTAVSNHLNDEGWSGRISSSNGSGGWVTAENLLAGLGGEPAVLLRVAFGADGSIQDDGFAFDNLEIFQLPPTNFSVVEVQQPTSGCGLSASNQVTISYANAGSQAFSSVDLSYTINGGAPVTETTTTTVNPGDTVSYTFTVPANLSATGLYDIVVYGSLTGDTDPGNDTLQVQVENIPVIAAFPYFEDFESGNAGWTADGANSSWAFGTPAKSVITGASSGVNAWVTGGLSTGTYSANEISFVLGPCFDFTNMSDPQIRLDVWWQSENGWDGAALQSSIDGGQTWQNVGLVNDPNNWYNRNNFFNTAVSNHLNDEGWSGRISTNNGSGGWVTAENAMSNLAGEPGVLLRIAFGSDGSIQDDGFAFDNVEIFDKSDNDVGVAVLLSPGDSECSSDSTPVEVMLVNFGAAAQDTIPVTVVFTGGVTSTLSGTYIGLIQPGDSASFLVGNLNTQASGFTTVTAYTSLSTDTLNRNDTLVSPVDIQPSPAPPFVIADSVCATDSAQFTLIATNVQDVTYWYDSADAETPIFVGDTFVTPFLTSTTEYFVETQGQSSFSLGEPDNTFGTGGQVGFEAGMLFDAFTDMSIDSVTVYPGNAGTFAVALEDANGFELYRDTISYGGVGSPDTTLFLGWEVTPGTNYALVGIPLTADLFRNSTGGTSYPYEIPNVCAITNPTNLSTAFYYFFYDWKVTGLGCSSDRTVATAFFRPAANVDLGPDGIQCEGFTIDAFDPGTVSYMWNTGDMTPSISANNTGIYYVDVTNAQGCTGTDTVILTVLPAPTVDLGPDQTVCGGLLLDAGNAGASYTWQNPDSTDQTFFADQTGTYAVTVIDQGCSATDTVDLVVNPAPMVDLGDPTIVSCVDVTLDAGNPGATILWSTSATTPTITVTPPTTGADTLSVSVTAANGCETTDQVVIEAGTPPALSIAQTSPVTGCDSVTLDAQASGVSFMWMPSGETTESITASSSDTYLVTATDPATGCENTASVEVDLSFTPIADASFAVLDPATGFSYEFVNQSTAAGTVTWDFGDGSPSLTGDTVSHTYQFAGAFLVTMTITNECGTDNTTLELGTVSLDDEGFGRALSLYPNPTTGRFSLTGTDLSAEQLEIEVYDARGRLVQSLTLDNVMGGFRQEVDLSDAAEGVYQLRITDGQRVALKRVVRH